MTGLEKSQSVIFSLVVVENRKKIHLQFLTKIFVLKDPHVMINGFSSSL